MLHPNEDWKTTTDTFDTIYTPPAPSANYLNQNEKYFVGVPIALAPQGNIFSPLYFYYIAAILYLLGTII